MTDRNEKRRVSDAEEGDPSTNVAAGGQASNAVATSRDQGRSRVDRPTGALLRPARWEMTEWRWIRGAHRKLRRDWRTLASHQPW
jgi:hypothetical protein